MKRIIKGFTILEVLVVAAILGTVALVVVPKLGQIKNKQIIKSGVSDIIGGIDDARSRSFASMQNTEWSVHFETNKVVIYKGTGAYDSSIINAPECNDWAGQTPCKITTNLVSPAQITDIDLSGGGSEFYFSRLNTTPSKTGTITVTVGDDSQIITIGPTGIVSTTTPVPDTYSVTVTMAGVYGSSTVTSSPSGIDCSTDCSESYNTGTDITLTANPISGYTFSGWSGDCTGTGTCVINDIAGAKAITATFAAVPRTVTVTMSGDYGASTVTSNPVGINCISDCTENYDNGTNVTLTANPASGYTFSNWSVDCTGSSTCVFNNISANKSVTANFIVTPVTRSVTVTMAGSYGSSTVTSAPTGISCVGDCSENYNDGTDVTLTANPASGYSFSGWSGNCSGTGTCVFNDINADKAVTATFAAIPVVRTLTISMAGSYGASTVISNSPTSSGISCLSNCTEDYNDATPVTLSVSPASGYTFVGWTNGNNTCTGTTTPCVLNMTSDITLTATFAVTRTLNINSSGGTVTGTGISCGADCAEGYADGTNVTLTATPTSGYVFTGWSGGNNTCTGTTTPCSVNMTTDLTVTASFAVIRTLNINSSGGAVTGTGISCGADCTEDYAHGTNVGLTATANSGYSFTGWSGGNNTCTGTTTPCSVNMTSDLTVTASFAPIPRNVTVTMAGSYGSSTVTSTPSGINCITDCSENFNDGTNVTLTANPVSGYTFSSWSGTSSGECSGSTCSFNSINADKSVTANFIVTPSVRTVTITMAGNYGTSTVTSSPAGISCPGDCTEDFSDGTNVTLTANPASGFAFSTGWSGDCTGTSTCVFNGINANKNVTATFTGFPQVKSTNTSTSPDSSTTHTVSLPSGIETGDLILLFMAIDNSSTTVTWPSGWTQLANNASGSNRISIAYKVATSAGGSSVNVTTSNQQPSAHQTVRISGFTGTPAISSVASGTSSSLDTPNLDPSAWGTAKTLWFSVTARNSGSSRPTSVYPTNYTNGVTVHIDDPTSGTDGATLSTARRELEASSENPGAFTITGGTDPWRGYTIGIQGL